MEFSVIREQLLQPLMVVSSVVEKRQTLPILSNIQIRIDNGLATLTATDLEVEMSARVPLKDYSESLETTVPARKLVDICKAAPAGCEVKFVVTAEKIRVLAGRAKFTLSVMDSREYPTISLTGDSSSIQLSHSELQRILSQTQFAMAQQDVRYYLNGLFFDLQGSKLTVVGTEGHRLAMAKFEVDQRADKDRQLIVPRKTVLEMLRLLDGSDDAIKLVLGDDHFIFESGSILFRSKLIEGNFPDYRRVIPSGVDNKLICKRKELKEVLGRVAILANEKYRAVRMKLSADNLSLSAHNQENEEAEEDLGVTYSGDEFEIGFNASYFLDVLGALTTDDVEINFGDSNSSCLIVAPGSDQAQYVIMPMRL
jgi:DNA polymerase-3 subunit beta